MVFDVAKFLKFVPVVFLTENIEVDQVAIEVQKALQEMAWEQVEVVEKLASQVVENMEKHDFLLLHYRIRVRPQM